MNGMVTSAEVGWGEGLGDVMDDDDGFVHFRDQLNDGFVERVSEMHKSWRETILFQNIKANLQR